MKKKWRKILYEDQGVSDNYVDETFLEEMKKNLYTRTYNFWSVVKESGVVTQQLSCVCLFSVLFVYMDQGYVSPSSVCVSATTITLLGYITNSTLVKNQKENGQNHNRTVWDDFRTTLIFVAFSYGLSPVLMTLTRTISTDTIYAMTVAMLLAHLLFHDYGARAAMVSQPLSLNAAIFASVCLASRLPSTSHAFTTITCAVEMFALSPVLRQNLKISYPQSQNFMTVILGISSLVAIATVSTVCAILFFIFHIFVNFVCPVWLIKLQPYKNNIYGPWDEAIIKE